MLYMIANLQNCKLQICQKWFSSKKNYHNLRILFVFQCFNQSKQDIGGFALKLLKPLRFEHRTIHNPRQMVGGKMHYRLFLPQNRVL